MDVNELLRLTPEGQEKFQRESWTPLDITSELLRRAKLLDAAEKDPELQAGLRAMCKFDVFFFINNFCWIYEPRAGREHFVPWILYPHEYLTIEWLEQRFKNQEDGLVEKSRDMGVTWTVVSWMMWHFLFDDEFSALIGSKKEEDVDNRLPQSVFGKIDYLLDHLPLWMLPTGWDKNKNRNFLKITYPGKINSITGESANDDFSRSGRYSVIFLDEFAFVERSFSIWQAAGDSTSVRIPVSTPKGKGNKFGELAHNDTISKLTLHWTLHPEKNKEWYEGEKKRRTDDEIAQELDISYDKSQRGRVYKTEWDALCDDGRLTDLTWDPMLPVDTSWDFGIGGSTAICFWQQLRDGSVKMVDYYEKSGFAIDHYVKILEGKPYRYGKHYGDITIARKELGTGKSVWEILKGLGIVIRGKILRNKDDAINAAKLMMRQMYVNKKNVQFIDAVENYHYDFDEEKQEFSPEPVHDWSSHACDSMTYYAINRKPNVVERQGATRDLSKFRHSTTTY